MDYNRYSKFTRNGNIALVPFIKIPVKQTDYYDFYRKGQTRLDRLSYKYYGDPNFGWLILQANPSCGGLNSGLRTTRGSGFRFLWSPPLLNTTMR